jgi:hypothetical protein
MIYAAYLRIYEPVAAFHGPDRCRWAAAYATSHTRPRRRGSLAEQAKALQRAITTPGGMVPGQESEHALYTTPMSRARRRVTRGLAALRGDEVLSRDQSAAQIRAAIDGAVRGQPEFAVAMYHCAHAGWRSVAGFELAN